MPECTAEVEGNTAKIEEILDDDPLQEHQTPIIASLDPMNNEPDIILDTKSIKRELSSKYSGLKKSVRTELAYLQAFSEQSSPSFRPVFNENVSYCVFD